MIGSSDIPIIIKPQGSRIKKTAYELWEEKRGKVPIFEGNDFTYWGHALEPLLIEKFIADNSGLEIAHRFKMDYIKHEHFRPDDYFPTTSYLPFTECMHEKFNFAYAHADCFLNDHVKPFLIEAKTGGYYARVKKENQEGFDLNDHSINGVPTDVILQVQWQMLVYNVNLTYVLLLVDDNKFHVYEVPAIKKWWPFMLEKAANFVRCCETDTPPQPENYDDVKKLFPEVFDRSIYITGEQSVIAREMKHELKTLSKKKKQIENRIDDIKNAAGLLMGDNKYLYDGETGDKLFQQVISEKNQALIHPSTIKKNCPEAYKLLEESGSIKFYDKRCVL